MSEGIPDDIFESLRDRVGSVEQLEAVLLLRSEPNRGWSFAEVSARLSIPDHDLERGLRDLATVGLLGCRGRGRRVWKYEPEDPAIARSRHSQRHA